MRLRKVKGAQEKLDSYPDIVIANPKEHKGKWRELFGNDKPIHIEIGMGKGSFLMGMAKQNRDVNFIGIELFESVLVRALEKFIDEPMDNVRLLKVNANFLADFFIIQPAFMGFPDTRSRTGFTGCRHRVDVRVHAAIFVVGV